MNSRTLILFFVFGIAIAPLIHSCRNHDEDTGFKTTASNTVLKSDSMWIADTLRIKFREAKVKTFEYTDGFPEEGAKFKIEGSSLYLDSAHSIMLWARITLLKGADGCEFSGYVDKQQVGEQDWDDANTFSMVSIEYAKKEGPGVVSARKGYNLHSQGSISYNKKLSKEK